MPEDSTNGPTVRRIGPDEGQALRATRLAALADAPYAFASIYTSESSRTDVEWEARANAGAAGLHQVTFFAEVEHEIVGLVGGFLPDADDSLVELVSMWTSPTARRAGVGSALVTAVFQWATA